jgi:hypothetical protein
MDLVGAAASHGQVVVPKWCGLEPRGCAEVITDKDREKVAELIALLQGGDFWVHAQEQDGDDEYRLTVSYGGDTGRWFTIRLEFPAEQNTEQSQP